MRGRKRVESVKMVVGREGQGVGVKIKRDGDVKNLSKYMYVA